MLRKKRDEEMKEERWKKVSSKGRKKEVKKTKKVR